MISSRTLQVTLGILLIIQGIIMQFGKFNLTGQFLAIESVILLILAGAFLRRHIIIAIAFIIIGVIINLSRYFSFITHIYLWVSIICLTSGVIFILLPSKKY